ncbi:MAG: type II toxin-antitoxin system HicB family antitoxin [Neisseriaceae bacterium]|nr:type II toxin-antitoxin system HicB family antitoxin [Neisseriaceae bacterium]
MIYYPMAIFQDENQSNFGAIIPDLQGAYPVGDTIEELIQDAQELTEFHIEGLLDAGLPLNDKPKSIQEHRLNPEYKDAILWAMVAVDETQFVKQVRFNVSWSEYLLKQVDEYVAQHHETRSGFLAKVVQKAMR